LIRDAGIRADLAVSDRPQPTSPKHRIRQLDRLLARDPDAVELRFERAGLLREQGLFDRAKHDYLELIRRRPTDFTALNDFGSLALKAGYKDAAQSLYREAVRHHPDNPMGRVNLANLLFLLGEQEQARAQFEAALRIDPDHIHANRGMGNVLAEAGDEAGARRHRDKGFKNQFLTTMPYRGDGTAIRVLLLVSAVGGNTPMASFLDDHYFETTVLVTEYYDAHVPLRGAQADAAAGDQSSARRSQNRPAVECAAAARPAGRRRATDGGIEAKHADGPRRRGRCRKRRVFIYGPGTAAGLPHRPSLPSRR
jgi:tetratricopeptide (TPR) repeat protein